MSKNEKFKDLMSDINNKAKEKNFTNGLEWARYAQMKDQISYSEYADFRNYHCLRNTLAHGGAKDISISHKTYSLLKKFYKKILASTLYKTKEAEKELYPSQEKPSKILKQVELSNKDGKIYKFDFEIIPILDSNSKLKEYSIMVKNSNCFYEFTDNLHKYNLKRTNDNRLFILSNVTIINPNQIDKAINLWTKNFINCVSNMQNKNRKFYYAKPNHNATFMACVKC